MNTKGKIVVDVSWVILALGVAYFCLKLELKEMDVLELMRTILFLVSTAVAVGFVGKTVTGFARLLRENACTAKEEVYLQRLKETIRLERESAHG